MGTRLDVEHLALSAATLQVLHSLIITLGEAGVLDTMRLDEVFTHAASRLEIEGSENSQIAAAVVRSLWTPVNPKPHN